MDIILQRILARTVEDEHGCLIWQGACAKTGYGVAWDGHSARGAHRIVFERSVGAVPAGQVLDHLCRNRRCVNIAHLEPVTPQENVLRGLGPAALNALKTHCPFGHEYSDSNTMVVKKKYRGCKQCYLDLLAKRRATLLHRGPDGAAICCKRGHPLTADNVYTSGRERPTCKTCFRERARAYAAKKKTSARLSG